MRKQREREKRTKKEVVKGLLEFPVPDAQRGEYVAQVRWRAPRASE